MCVHVCVSACLCECVRACACMSVCVCVCACMSVSVCACLCVRACLSVCVRVHVCVCVFCRVLQYLCCELGVRRCVLGPRRLRFGGAPGARGAQLRGRPPRSRPRARGGERGGGGSGASLLVQPQHLEHTRHGKPFRTDFQKWSMVNTFTHPCTHSPADGRVSHTRRQPACREQSG